MQYSCRMHRQLLCCLFILCTTNGNASERPKDIRGHFTIGAAKDASQKTFPTSARIHRQTDTTESDSFSDSAGTVQKQNEFFEQDWQIRLYPNPATHTARFDVRNIPVGDYILRVLSMHGEVLMTRRLEVGSSAGVYTTIELSSLAAGSYILQLHHRYDEFIASYPLTVVH